MDYVADYDSRKMLRPDCIHSIPLQNHCGTCEHEIQFGEAIGLGGEEAETVEITPSEFYTVHLYNLKGSEGDHNTRVDVDEALRRDIESHLKEPEEE